MYCAFVCPTLLSAAIPSTTVYPISHAIPFSLTARALSGRAIPVYTCLSCAFYLCYPPLQLSTLCAINLCYSSLQLSTLCYQSLLSPFTSVYPMLSDSAIPLYYCLPCAISLCYPPFNCLPYAFSLCYPPLLLSTLCFLSLPSPMHSNCLACAFSLCYSPSNCLPSAISLCYSPLQLSTLCYQSLLSPLQLSLCTTSLCYPLYNCLPYAVSLCYSPSYWTNPVLSVFAILVDACLECLPCTIILCYLQNNCGAVSAVLSLYLSARPLVSPN
jgi:hypothetical protein